KPEISRRSKRGASRYSIETSAFTERGCGEAQPQHVRTHGRFGPTPDHVSRAAAAGLRHSRAPVAVSRCARAKDNHASGLAGATGFEANAISVHFCRGFTTVSQLLAITGLYTGMKN